MELELRYYPDPGLREKAATVTEFDDALREFAEAMVETMFREKGIGLAASQVGIGKRVIVALQMKDTEDTDVAPLILINPRVVSAGGEVWSYEEGCLSIPGVTADVRRHRVVEVEYQDLDGEVHRVRDEDMFGRILLHEIDHTEGRLFIDYLSSAQKSLMKSQLKELKAKHSS